MRVIIYAPGGHGKVVADVVRACGHEVAGFVDIDDSRLGQVAEPGGARVLYVEEEFIETLDEARDFDAIAQAVSHNATRLRCFFEVLGTVSMPAFVHPSAVISPSAQIGDGTIVMPNVVVNAAATVGRACILNTGCIVEHDVTVGDGAHISPNATIAGEATVGECAWIGAGATVLPTVSVGAQSTVGAGAVVIADVPEEATVVGVPAGPVGG